MKPIRFKAITLVIVFSILASTSAAILAVKTYNDRADSNCAAIKRLRTDLVQVVKDGEIRSQHSITKVFKARTRDELLRNLHEQTRRTVDKISNPNCP